MRRFSRLWSLFAVLLLGVVVTLAGLSGAVAQDATPGAGQSTELMPGVTMDSMPPTDDQGGPANYRLHIEPHATFPVDPGGTYEVVVVEAGTLTVRFNGGIVVGVLDATAPASETVAAGTDATLTAGQYFLLPPALAGELRNEGDVTVTILVAEVPAAITATPGVATPAG